MSRGVVTLCGSVRFKEEFDRVAEQLTLWGYIVLMPNVWGKHDVLHTNAGSAVKACLDKLHFDKIMISDSIVIINEGSYIGQSTAREIDFARRNDKIVYDLQSYHLLEKRGQ